MKSTEGKLMIIIILLMVHILYVCGSFKNKEEYAQFYPISDVTSELVDKDLEVGLQSLSSNELKTLSEYIDEESTAVKSNAFEDVADAYIKGDSLSGDLNYELSIDNLELNTESEVENNPLKLSENEKNLDKSDTIRTKRNSPEDYGCAGIVNIEDYFKELENSFPQNQKDYINDTDEMEKEHIRVKRL